VIDDDRILDALDSEEWRTAETVVAHLPPSRYIDGRKVGGRLSSLRNRGYVESRTAPDGYRAEWRLV
jgi:hypothetical protein